MWGGGWSLFIGNHSPLRERLTTANRMHLSICGSCYIDPLKVHVCKVGVPKPNMNMNLSQRLVSLLKLRPKKKRVIYRVKQSDNFGVNATPKKETRFGAESSILGAPRFLTHTHVTAWDPIEGQLWDPLNWGLEGPLVPV